jgi:hypothetical protein
MTTIRVRGALVTRQRAYMESFAGRAAVASAVASLPSALRASYDEASMLSWVPQEAVREVTRRVATSLSMSPVDLAERVVTDSVSSLCAGPWNILLRLTSDEALVSRAAAIFQRAFDAGSVETRLLAEGEVELVLRGWPGADDMDLASLSAGIRATLGAVGRTSRVERSRTSDGALFRVHVV